MWRIDRAADYGAFQDAARGRVDLARIERRWEDILRIIGSIHTGAVRAYDVIRMLSRDGRPTPLGDAIAHYGRISKTLHILRLADEPGYRRQIKSQANLQEGRHALARKIFHGRSGQLYQRYQDGMEDQIGALGPVLNALVRPVLLPASRPARRTASAAQSGRHRRGMTPARAAGWEDPAVLARKYVRRCGQCGMESVYLAHEAHVRRVLRAESVAPACADTAGPCKRGVCPSAGRPLSVEVQMGLTSGGRDDPELLEDLHPVVEPDFLDDEPVLDLEHGRAGEAKRLSRRCRG